MSGGVQQRWKTLELSWDLLGMERAGLELLWQGKWTGKGGNLGRRRWEEDGDWNWRDGTWQHWEAHKSQISRGLSAPKVPKLSLSI